MARTPWTDEFLDEHARGRRPARRRRRRRALRGRQGRRGQPPHEDARAQRRRAGEEAAARRARLPRRDRRPPGVGRRRADRARPAVLRRPRPGLRHGARVRVAAGVLRDAPRRAGAEPDRAPADRPGPPDRRGRADDDARHGAGRPRARRRRGSATPRRCGSCTPPSGTSRSPATAGIAEWGTPVNQEDLAVHAHDVLGRRASTRSSKLGTTVTDEEADGYFHCWNCVGHVLGVDAPARRGHDRRRAASCGIASPSATGRRARRARR